MCHVIVCVHYGGLVYMHSGDCMCTHCATVCVHCGDCVCVHCEQCVYVCALWKFAFVLWLIPGEALFVL